MVLRLTVFERIILLEIINSIEFGFLFKKAFEYILAQLYFSIEELNDLQFSVDNGKIKWIKQKVSWKEIMFPKFGEDLIKKCLLSLKEEGLLEKEHMALYDKFIK